MEQEQQSVTDARRKRVQRLKKMIIISLLVVITVPWILCAVLFVYTGSLSRELEQLRKQVSSFMDTSERQAGEQERITEQLRGELQELEEQLQYFLQQQVTEENTLPEETAPADTEQKAKHQVYLTFDDGPSSNTDRILDILKEYDVKATFFVLGRESESDRRALKRIVEEGHSLGMHSYSHRYEDIYASRERFVADFEKLQNYLYEVTGVESRLYRFPGGSSNSVSSTDIHGLIDYLEEQDVTYFDWNVASGDATKEGLSAEAILRNSTEGVGDRAVSVILFHDAAGRETTVEALPRIIEKIQSMEDVEFLPLTPETEPVQHVKTSGTRQRTNQNTENDQENQE